MMFYAFRIWGERGGPGRVSDRRPLMLESRHETSCRLLRQPRAGRRRAQSRRGRFAGNDGGDRGGGSRRGGWTGDASGAAEAVARALGEGRSGPGAEAMEGAWLRSSGPTERFE